MYLFSVPPSFLPEGKKPLACKARGQHDIVTAAELQFDGRTRANEGGPAASAAAAAAAAVDNDDDRKRQKNPRWAWRR